MNKKLSLDKLKISSFVTDVESKKSITIYGGSPPPPQGTYDCHITTLTDHYDSENLCPTHVCTATCTKQK